MSKRSNNKLNFVLFDIDGTLIRTHGIGRRALMRAFEELFGTSVGAEEVSYKGRTDPDLILETSRVVLGRNLSEDDVQRVVDCYLNYFERSIFDDPGFVVLKGVNQLIATLAHCPALMLGVETGNVERAAWAKLRRAEVHAHFRFGGFGSDSSERAELVRTAIERGVSIAGRIPDRVYVIGDAPQDILAALAVEAVPIGVTHGSDAAEALRAAGAKHIFDDFSEAARILELVQE